MLRVRSFALLAAEGDGGNGGGAPESFSREYVQELRQESAHHRVKAAEAQKAVAEAQRVAAEVVRSANERVVRAELKAVALRAGIVDVDALKLADLAQVRLNEAGEVEGAEALIATLKEAKPYLFGGAAGAGNSGSTQAAPKPAAQTPVDARKMSAEEYARARARFRG